MATGRPDHLGEAESCFQEALKFAQRQEARFWELRAACGLATLWSAVGRTEEVRKLLSPIYRKFDDGIEFPDLMKAKKLLDDAQSNAKSLRHPSQNAR